jgi:hypothetical protein
MSSSRQMSSLVSAVVLVVLWGTLGHTRHGELPNRIPEATPYNVTEAEIYPPSYEDKWATINHPLLCADCRPQTFQEWHGSMMANAWRDSGWRGAFILLSRMTTTHGDCAIPTPHDGMPKVHLNPFANADCSSTRTTSLGAIVTSPGSCGQISMPRDRSCRIPSSPPTVFRRRVRPSP